MSPRVEPASPPLIRNVQADKAEKAAEPKTEEKKDAKAAAGKKGAKEKGAAKEPEVVNLGPPGVAPGELVFGVAHIFASFNDTFVVRLRTYLSFFAGGG